MSAEVRQLFENVLGVRNQPVDIERLRVFVKDEMPFSIDAPVITDAREVQPLLDLITALQTHSNAEVAQRESQRLKPYFHALNIYLKQVLKGAGTALTTSGALCGLFNKMAACTRNTILSEVVIVPSDIIRTGPAAKFMQQVSFNKEYTYNGSPFYFGFVEVVEKNDPLKKSSTTFPTLMIDHRMLKKIAPYGPQALLYDLQDVMTMVNHDALHHFCSIVIYDDILCKWNGDYLRAPMLDWRNNIPRPDGIDAGETWAQITHEQTWTSPGNKDLLKDVWEKVDRYFGELQRIGASMTDPKAAHETVDYFGMMMAHALTRAFPLDHPMIAHCVKRLQEADPLSGQAFSGKREVTPKTAFSDLRARAEEKDLQEILKAYKDSSFDILPERDEDVGYLNIKLFELLSLGKADVQMHMPRPTSPLRTTSGQSLVKMLRAAAASVRFKPD